MPVVAGLGPFHIRPVSSAYCSICTDRSFCETKSKMLSARLISSLLSLVEIDHDLTVVYSTDEQDETGLAAFTALPRAKWAKVSLSREM